MSLPQFMHFAPKSLQEASRLLVQHPGAKILAGGTDLLVKMKQRRAVPRHVVNIKRIPGLDGIAFSEGSGMRIGALATLEELNRSVAVRERFPMLHDAVASMGTLEIRHRGTLAGNLCNASPAAEANPRSDLWGSAEYKREAAATLVERVLRRALQRAGRSSS